MNEIDYRTDYRYDLVGNRLFQETTRGLFAAGLLSGDSERTVSTFNDRDQLVDEVVSARPAGASDFSETGRWQSLYDLAGNQTQRARLVSDGQGGFAVDPDNLTTYRWDPRRRLIGSTQRSRETSSGPLTETDATFGYNETGLRVSRSVSVSVDGQPASNQETVYLLDPANPTGYAQVLEEHSVGPGGTRSLATSYLLGADVLAQFRPGTGPGSGTLLLIPDGHGSTRLVVDSSVLSAAITQAAPDPALPAAVATAIVDRLTYDAYGQVLDHSPTPLTTLLYTGEQFDPTLGQYYLRARYYDPAQGRFTAMDPFAGIPASPTSLHRYRYANNDPVNFVDPTGLFEGLIGVLTGTNIQTLLSQIQINVGQSVLDTLGYTDFSIDPRDYVTTFATNALLALVPQAAKDATAKFFGGLTWMQVGIAGGAIAAAGVAAGAAIGFHQHRVAELARVQQKLVRQIEFVEFANRVARIMNFPDLAQGGKTIGQKEAIGLARLEAATGRSLRPPAHAGHDAVDGFFGHVQLKGPLISPTTLESIVSPQSIEGLYQSTVKAARYGSGFDTLVVDLSGLTKVQVDDFMARVQRESLPKPVQFVVQ